MTSSHEPYLNHNFLLEKLARTGTYRSWLLDIVPQADGVRLTATYSVSDIANAVFLASRKGELANDPDSILQDMIVKHSRGWFTVGDVGGPTGRKFEFVDGAFRDSLQGRNRDQVTSAEQLEVLILQVLRHVRDDLVPGLYRHAIIDFQAVALFRAIAPGTFINALHSLKDQGMIESRGFQTGELWGQFARTYVTQSGLNFLRTQEQNGEATDSLTSNQRPAARLLRVLTAHRFADSDFERLAFDLGIDRDQIPGRTWVEQMIHILRKAETPGALNKLIRLIIEARSDLEPECNEILRSVTEGR